MNDSNENLQGESTASRFGKIMKLAAPIVGVCLFCLGVFVVFLVVLIILGIIDISKKDSNGGSVAYDSECNYENTMVTVMDGSNTKVLATISLEDYVIGVSCPEIGACSGASSVLNENYVKAQYVIAKTYSLARGNYDSSTKTITVRASTKDQQWCSLDKGCIVTRTNEIVPGTSSVFYNTYPGDYTASQIDGSETNRYSFTEEDLETFHRYYKETYGELFLSSSYNSAVSSLGWNDATEFKSDTQVWWRDQANAGKSYVQILDAMGTSGKSDAEDYVGKSIYKLGSYCKGTVTSGDFLDLGDYPDVTSKQELTKPISEVVSVDELNSYIDKNVKIVGHGSGAAVAAVGSSLIYGLYQRGYYLPYWYGGGHGSLATGVDLNWGKNGSSVDSGWAFSNSGRGRNIFSYDCSGFVSWAIKNGCKSGFSPDTTTGFMNYASPDSSASAIANAVPGDLMVYDHGGGTSGHIRLVVKNNGNSIITAESTSGYATHGSVLFHEYSSLNENGTQYYIIHMKDWYAKNCENIQEGTGISSSSNDSITDNSLKSSINSYLNSKAASGKWSVYVKSLKKNDKVEINSTNSMIAASEIKLFIMGATYDQINKGAISESSVNKDLKIMIENSDNDAANKLIDLVGKNTINSYISSNGYSSTKLNRKMLTYGDENYVSASDIGKFLENVYNGKVVNSNYSSKMLKFLKNQKTTFKIPGGLGCSNCSASKSGELPDKGVANDAAIVYANDYILVVLSEVASGNYEKANRDIVEISKIVYNYFN